MANGCYNAFFSVGDADNVNTTIYIDKDNYIWITENESVKRIKTSINVDNIIGIRSLAAMAGDSLLSVKTILG